MAPLKARTKSTSNRKSCSSNNSSIDDTSPSSQQLIIASQLFEETIDCAVDDGNTNDAATFAAFVMDMLPPDVLETLKQVAGFELDSHGDATVQPVTPSSFSGAIHDWTFLTDVWHERFYIEDNDTSATESSSSSDYECELCDRVIQTTRHHLYPRETHSWLQSRDPIHYTDIRMGTTMYVPTRINIVPISPTHALSPAPTTAASPSIRITQQSMSHVSQCNSSFLYESSTCRRLLVTRVATGE